MKKRHQQTKKTLNLEGGVPSYAIEGKQLKKWVIEKLVSSEHRRTRVALMDLLEKSESSIGRYLHRNHPLLSKEYSLAVICAYLQCEPEMITEPRPLPQTKVPAI
jgi:hypothetical protein